MGSTRALRLTAANNTWAPAFLHKDHLGSVRAISGAGGAVEERTLYRPYGGQTEVATATLNDDKSWLGERYDAGAGLQYLNARYYDPELAMFLQPDWFEVMQPGVGTNRYAYAAGDPINRLDPWGNAWWNDWGDLKDALDSIGNAYDRARETASNTLRDTGHPIIALGFDMMAPNYGETKAGIERMQNAYESGDYGKMALGGIGVVAGLLGGKGKVLGEAAKVADKLADGIGDLLGIGRKVGGGADEAADAAGEATTVIGRTRDLQNLGPNEKSLLDRLQGNLGSPKANWERNSGVLREEMGKGLPIRDASPGDNSGVFLNAERNLLESHGWRFDSRTNLWKPSVPQ